MDDIHSWFATLGLTPGASPAEIKQAYRDLVRVWHPDRFHDPRLITKAQDRLKQINQAYECIQAFLAQQRAHQLRSGPTRPSAAQREHEPAPHRAGPRPMLLLAAGIALLCGFLAGLLWQGGYLSRLASSPAAERDEGGVREPASEARPSPKTPAPRSEAPRKGTTPKLNQGSQPTSKIGVTGLDRDYIELERSLRRGDAHERDLNEQGLLVLALGRGVRRLESLIAAERLQLGLSLPSGTNLRPPLGPHGRGSLRVLNGTDRDAVVRLVDVLLYPSARRVVYIQAHGETVIRNVGPGTYELRFGLGTHWDGDKLRFARDRVQFRFLDPIVLTETRTDAGVDYVKHKVTLHRVPGGNARTETIGESLFESE